MTVYHWVSNDYTKDKTGNTHSFLLFGQLRHYHYSGSMVSHDSEAVAMLSVLHVHIYSTKWVKQGIQADLVKTSQHKSLINP